jgi:hypothetical protein
VDSSTTRREFSVLGPNLFTTPGLLAESLRQTPHSGSGPYIVSFSPPLKRNLVASCGRGRAHHHLPSIPAMPWTFSSSSKKPQPPPTGSQVANASTRSLVAHRRCWAQSWQCNDSWKSGVRCGVRRTSALLCAPSRLRRHEKPVDMHAAWERFIAPHGHDLWNPGNAHARHVAGPFW